MNIEQFHTGLETRDIGLLFKISTKDFMDRMIERGALPRLQSVFPLGETAVRNTIDSVETENARVSTIENIYILNDELVTITDLIWEKKENDVWKVSNFWVLEMMGEHIDYIS